MMFNQLAERDYYMRLSNTLEYRSYTVLDELSNVTDAFTVSFGRPRIFRSPDHSSSAPAFILTSFSAVAVRNQSNDEYNDFSAAGVSLAVALGF